MLCHCCAPDGDTNHDRVAITGGIHATLLCFFCECGPNRFCTITHPMLSPGKQPRWWYPIRSDPIRAQADGIFGRKFREFLVSAKAAKMSVELLRCSTDHQCIRNVPVPDPKVVCIGFNTAVMGDQQQPLVWSQHTLGSSSVSVQLQDQPGQQPGRRWAAADGWFIFSLWWRRPSDSPHGWT